jgi:ABC-type phosphate transport system substrate-binding protein
MAVQAATVTRNITQDDSAIQIAWAPLANGDTGAWIAWPQYSNKSFQVSGTFGTGGSVSIEGSNDPAPLNTAVLSTWQGTALTTTQAAFLTPRDMPLWVRPHVTAGDGTTALTVTLVAHRADVSNIDA